MLQYNACLEMSPQILKSIWNNELGRRFIEATLHSQMKLVEYVGRICTRFAMRETFTNIFLLNRLCKKLVVHAARRGGAERAASKAHPQQLCQQCRHKIFHVETASKSEQLNVCIDRVGTTYDTNESFTSAI